MIRTLIAVSALFAVGTAVPAAAAYTVVVNFSSVSCPGSCVNGSLIGQFAGDSVDVNSSFRATAGIGNSATADTSLRYWQNSYSNSDAVYSQSGFGEVRLDVTTAGTLTLDSVDFGGWPNTVRNIQYRVYDLGYTLLTSGNLDTNPLALTTIAFGQNSTAGLIFQFGGDGFNGGIQNVTYSFDDDRVGGIPEPASWVMLIAGFGLTGAAMRRRRHAVV